MLKQHLSRIAYLLSVGCGVSRVARRLNRHKLLILLYHRVHTGAVDAIENFDGFSVQIEDFVRQMRYLAKHYQVVPLDRCLDQQPTSTYRAAIAFDDGYASVYHYAYPVLRSLRLPATVFVPTDFIETRVPMWWDRLRQAVRMTTDCELVVTYEGQRRVLPVRTRAEKEMTLRELIAALRRLPAAAREEVLAKWPTQMPAGTAAARHAPLTLAQMREMAEHRISFASHGKSHQSFPLLSAQELWREVYESKIRLEEWVGKPVTWLAYPFGDLDQRALDLLPRAGYQGAVTTIDGLSNGEGHFVLRRIAVGGQTTFPQFVAAVSGVREAAAWLRTKGGKGSLL